ncbi:MAG: hypothetical protein IPL27_00080 [Lewinellaceae bacterium]|nr:hypothetical protein [Lewinellaceae bacterium]MBP9830799.1 hypothetical protein [Polaromonas sp.]
MAANADGCVRCAENRCVVILLLRPIGWHGQDLSGCEGRAVSEANEEVENPKRGLNLKTNRAQTPPKFDLLTFPCNCWRGIAKAYLHRVACK